ncbi:MAG TPA: hypothetical protein V6C57_16875 [Coleofasciculaceae cyanobacterium]
MPTERWLSSIHRTFRMATLKLKQIVYKNCSTTLRLQPKLEDIEIGDPIEVSGTGVKAFPRKKTPKVNAAIVKFSSNDKRLFLQNLDNRVIYKSNPMIMPLDDEDGRVFKIDADSTIEIRYEVEQ